MRMIEDPMSCCMFKSRRTTLVRRLWKLRCQNETGCSSENSEDLELKSVAHSMLKRLKEKQLESLIGSVESRGGEEGDCVLLPRGETRLGKKPVTPLLLCCKMWRWNDITKTTQVKRLPCCTSRDDPGYECCNPYHWSLVTQPDTEVSNYGWTEIEKMKYTDHLDRPPDDGVSMETGMTPTPRCDNLSDESTSAADTDDSSSSPCRCTRDPHWCSIAYWELRQRVGRLLSVHNSHISVFQQLPHGDGMCLQVLQEPSATDSCVERTREKIGFGLVLSKEEDGVWLYNRCQYPVFVNSPTLEDPFSRTLYVHKVSPGYSLRIFDYKRGHLMEEIRDPKYLDGPYDPSSIRISFAKGWGPSYSRQFMTSCPCWLEILLNLKDR